MRFSFCVIPDLPLAEEVRAVASLERAGYAAGWFADQNFHVDPFVFIAACAGATERLRLGVGVTNPYTRRPVQVARAIATADAATGGRARLGFGAANRRELLLPLGLEQERPEPRCREALIVVRRLLQGEAVTWESPTLTMQGVRLDFNPVFHLARPNLPLYVAARGPQLLELGGELADGVIVGGYVSPPGLDFALAHVGKGAARAGRDPASLELVCWTFVRLVEDRRAGLDELRPRIAHQIAAGAPAMHRALGVSEGRAREIKARYAAGGPEVAARLVTDDDVDTLALVGDAAFLRQRIRHLADRGFAELALLVGHLTPSVRAILHRFAREVLPEFASA